MLHHLSRWLTSLLARSQASRAKQFYSTLHRFKTKMTVLSDEPTVRYSKQARRSISLPDFPLPPRPASLMLAPSKEQPTHRSSRLPSRKKLSIIPEPESAPAATCDFPFPTIAVEPSSRRQSRRAAAQTLDTEEPQDVLSAPAQFVEFSNLFDPPSAQLTALSLPSAVDFRSSTPSLLEEDQSSQRSVRRKKSSMQRIRSLFRRDESTSEGAETVVPLLSAPVAEAVQPASPLRDSFLKRSTGYSSLHKAIVGLAPGSPSPARASYVPSELGLPRAPSHTPQRKKSWLSRRSQVIEQEVAAQPTTSNDENVQQALQQLVGGASPMPSPVPSPTKRRPSPLNLVSSNLLGKSTSSTTSSSSPRPQAGLFTSRSGKRMLIAADADSGLLSPRSPLSDSSNEQDPFFLGSPFQPRPKQQQQQPITPPPRRQLSKAMRIQQLEDENAALLLEISLLKLTLLLKAAEMDSLEREKREVEREKEALWSKLEERRSVEAGEGELRRLSFGEEEGSEEEGGKRDSELSERLEERWLKMLGIEAGVVEGEP